MWRVVADRERVKDIMETQLKKFKTVVSEKYKCWWTTRERYKFQCVVQSIGYVRRKDGKKARRMFILEECK